MPLTPEDVQNKRFSTVRRFKEGYDEEEVDAFLDEVEAELRRLLAENGDLRTRAAAPAPVAPPAAEEPNEAALRTLLLAQRTADEAIAQAKQESEQIVANAKVRAAAIESEAQQQHAAAMAELARQRQTLEAQVEELRGFEREYRTRLKAYLEAQLRDLETRGQAPAAPAPPRPAAAPTAPPTGAPTAPAPPTAPPTAPPAAPPPSAGGPPRVGPSAAPAGGPPAASPPIAVPTATPTPAPSPAPSPAPAAPAAPGASPFSSAPRLVEDVDAGSDAPAGPPHEAEPDADEGDVAGR